METSIHHEEGFNHITEECLYYTLSELNELKQSTETFSFFHLNISSLNLHQDELTVLLESCNIKFDIIGITETGLHRNNDYSIDIENYSQEDCYTETPRGGTRLYVSKKHNYLPRADLQIYKKGELESIFVEILNEKGSNIIVACIYKHPNMDIDEFNILYSDLVEKMAQENKKLVVMGDFNVDLLKSETDAKASTFLQNNLTSCLKPFITKPTRVTPHSKTLINNIFSNYLENSFTAGNLICSISDHLPQFFLIHQDSNNFKDVNKVKRDYSKFNRENFVLDFLSKDWDILQSKNPEQQVEVLINKINKIIDIHAPLKIQKRKSKNISRKPWITQGIRNSINCKNKLFKKFVNTKSSLTKSIRHTNFKEYRNVLTKILKQSKNNYYKEYFETHKNDLRLVWKGIREAISGKRKSNEFPKLLVHENQQFNSQQDIANTFNNYYGSIAQKTKEKIIQTDHEYDEYLNRPNENSIFFSPTNSEEILKLIMNMNKNKATGPMSIPTSILKIIAPTFSDILSKIIKFCSGNLSIMFKKGLHHSCT